MLAGGEAGFDHIQLPGKGLRMSADSLREAQDRSVSLHRELLRYANAFLMQTTTTALANGRSKVEERLARHSGDVSSRPGPAAGQSSAYRIADGEKDDWYRRGCLLSSTGRWCTRGNDDIDFETSQFSGQF